jgi:hypothetical protein
MREVWKSPKEPFIIAGTGTLAMDWLLILIEKEIMYW